MRNRKETIRVENLVTGYSDKHKKISITNGINSSLYSGELTCLLGPNGAGKSTLLKTLSGFLPPLSGDVIIEGKNLEEYKDSDLAKVIGVVLTEKISLNNMSVYELVGMGRSPYTGFWGRLDTHDREVIEESFSLVHINDLRDRMVQTLSDGERQKVMIGKALAQETPIIFLDEPTAFLDYPSKVEIMQLLQNLSRLKQKTVFLSTHDLELALQIADKIWLIDKKLGVEIGTPEDLSAEGYLGKFFEREGIIFDIDSGLFKINHKLNRSIRIEGLNDRLNLLKKALSRNGIRADHDVVSDEIINLSKNGYIYNGQEYMTIGELLNAIL
ncbi:MAG: ABC transporter ATP-binding protein [Duncaniella sp.]|nr:ABC transporter ATP-binding protein [Muribaculum sp.]MCM1254628.1 ABC transporter ATP-binding protein [Duncaniella sp.]